MKATRNRPFYLLATLVVAISLGAWTLGSAQEEGEPSAPMAPAEPAHDDGTRVDAVIVDRDGLSIRVTAEGDDEDEDGSKRHGGIVRFGEDYEVGEEEIVTDDIVIFGGDLTAKGNIYGDAVVFGGRCRVEGEVSGDLVMIGGDADLGPMAEVFGNIVLIGGEVEKEPGAVVHGDEVVLAGIFKEMGLPGLTLFGAGLGLVVWLSTFMLFLFIALLSVVLFPDPLETVAGQASREPAQSLAAGFLGVIALVVVVLVLTVTIIGIPVAVLLAIGMVALQYFGRVAICLVVGRWVFDRAGIRWAFPFWGVAAGYLVIRLLELIPVVGSILHFLLFIGGLGCAVLAIWRSRKKAAPGPMIEGQATGTPEIPAPGVE